MRRLILVLVLAGLTAVLALGLGLRAGQAALDQPLPLQAAEMLDVPPGSSLTAVLRELQRRGWLSPMMARYLRLDARLRGAPPVLAGEYRIEPGFSLRDLLHRLRRGEVLLHRLQLVEGWTLREALATVRQHAAIRIELDEAELDPERLMAALGLPTDHAEGRLRPDTYHFPRGMTDRAFLRRAAQAQATLLAQVWDTRQPELPLADADSALILASIIEKETGVPAERGQVAGVFVNRLRLGMRLQTDPTVIYGLGPDFEGRLRRIHLTTDTPYNTYTRAGLPPTPICLPGAAALQAAVQPTATSALFFVAKGDGSGEHVFSDTLEAHNAAVQRYLQRLREQRNRTP